MPRATSQEADVTIDFPHEGEVVTSPAYTIRISSSEASNIEVSVDDGPWQSCRSSVGYWWFDWSGYSSGEHEITAQGRDANDDIVESSCEFIVELEPA